MSDSVVVDASLAVKWLVNEVHSDKAFALGRGWVRSGLQPVAPYLMPVEVANALHRRVVVRQLSVEAAIRLLQALLETGVELREPPNLHARSMQLATDLGQDAVYDAHYLALAEALDCDLWTADERFRRASSRRFPRVHWIGEA